MSNSKTDLIAVLPCNNLAASRSFYERLGFSLASDWDSYVILTNGRGGELHLRAAEEGWLVPGRNPFGLYLRVDDVDEYAPEFKGEMLGSGKVEEQPWGLREFAVSDPDETLVKVGSPVLSTKEPGSG